MTWFLIGLVVVWSVISKIRKMAGELQSGGGADRYREVRARIDSKAGGDQPFSLQQVLAEIEKVKVEAQRGRPVARLSREELKAKADAARSRRMLEDRPAGPMGRPSTRSVAVAEEVEEGQDQEHPAGFDSSATDAGSAERTVADQPSAATQAPAASVGRYKVADLRNALVWREILGVPVSMRDE